MKSLQESLKDELKGTYMGRGKKFSYYIAKTKDVPVAYVILGIMSDAEYKRVMKQNANFIKHAAYPEDQNAEYKKAITDLHDSGEKLQKIRY